jgi:hypothetical protein
MVNFTCPHHGQLTHTEELCPGCLYRERKKIEAEPQDPTKAAQIQQQKIQMAHDILHKLDETYSHLRPEACLRMIHEWPEPYWEEYRGKLVGRVIIDGQPHARVWHDADRDTVYIVILPWLSGMIDALEQDIVVHNGGNKHEYWVGNGGFDAIDPDSTLQVARLRLLERHRVRKQALDAELSHTRKPMEWEQEQEYERTM